MPKKEKTKVLKFYSEPTVIKVDVEKREVWGILASEQPDKDGEIMDYEKSKPHWVAWSDGIKALSAGKSLGNVRQMHSITLPLAGKLINFQCDDDNKRFIGCTKVTNDEVWKNVVEGVYTGYSLGGNYDGVPVKEAATGNWRYTIIPAEVSLVDNPCNPGATFDLICADGAIVKKTFVGKKEKAKMANNALAKRAKEKLAEAELLLKSISKGEVKKGMYAIGGLANLICDLNWMMQDAEWEASVEADDSEVPGMLRDILKQLAEALKAMTNEEVTELIGTDPAGKGTVKVEKIEITKAQADHLKKIGAIGEKIHKAHKEMGKHIDELLGTNSEEGENGKAEADEEEEEKKEKGMVGAIQKALAPTLKSINSAIEENKALKTQLVEQQEFIVELGNTVLKMAAQPDTAAMPKGNTQVSKGAEVGAPAVNPATAKDPMSVMKSVRDNGPGLRVIGAEVIKVA